MATDFSKRCFVIMPFGKDESEEAKWTARYRELIELAVLRSELGLETQRVDSLDRPGGIPEEIFRNLECSRFVIADLSGENQNVAYELGIRHARKHGTILIAERGTTLPFDFNIENVIFFPDNVVGRQKAADRIVKRLKGIASDPQLEDSPFFRAVPAGSSVPSLTPIQKKPRRSVRRNSFAHRIESILDAMELSLAPVQPRDGFFQIYLKPWPPIRDMVVHDVYAIARVLDGQKSVAHYMGRYTKGVIVLRSLFVRGISPSPEALSNLHYFKMAIVVPVSRKDLDTDRLKGKASSLFLAYTPSLERWESDSLEKVGNLEGTLEVQVWDNSGLNELERELHLR